MMKIVPPTGVRPIFLDRSVRHELGTFPRSLWYASGVPKGEETRKGET